MNYKKDIKAMVANRRKRISVMIDQLTVTLRIQ